jgi:hypothetical protein
MAKLRLLHNHIMFQFEDEVIGSGQNMKFKETTEWDFTVSREEEAVKQSRWATITHVGPNVTSVKVGDVALIEALKWTTGVVYENERYWRTDEEKVLALR